MNQNLNSQDIANQMKNLANNAVVLANKQYQVNLDFSVESLKLVEDILSKLSQDIPRNWFSRLLGRGPSKKQIDSICLILGAYVGEVIRIKWNGVWNMDSSFAKSLPCISVFGGNIYPTNKVYKRLIDGKEDNIWAYYQMLQNLKNGDSLPQDG